MSATWAGLRKAIAGVLNWLSRHKLECFIFLFGVLLRLTMITNYRFDWNYDSGQHWEVIEWIGTHQTIPNSESVFSSFHPPGYYLMGAWLIKHGWTRPELAYVSVAFGIARLLVIWLGLELWLPRHRIARVSALALASVVCASVHIDGMIYAEPVSSFIHAVLFVLGPLALARDAKFRLPLLLLLGLLFSAAFLIKISALVTVIAFFMAVCFRLLVVHQPLKKRATDALSFTAIPAIMITMCGWYFMQNMHQYGRPTVTSFNLPSQLWLMKEAEEKPTLDRRTLGYIFGWSREIYLSPYRPSALRPTARFFPVLIASSVVDYWDFGYAGYNASNTDRPRNMRRSSVALRPESQAAMFGGTAVFLAMVIAGGLAFINVVRRKDAGSLFLLLSPFLTLAAAVHFAVTHPVDDYGVVKGAYLVFAAAPAFALFGLAVDWACKRWARWPLTLVLFAAIASVGWYSVRARLSTHYPWEAATIHEQQTIKKAFQVGHP